MEFERYAFDKIPQVVGTSDDIRVRVGCRATYGNGPSVGMGLGGRFSLLWGEDAGCVPVDNRTINAKTLFNETFGIQLHDKKRKAEGGLNVGRTLTRTRSVAIVVVSSQGQDAARDRQGSDFTLLPLPTPSSSTLNSQWSSLLSLTVRDTNCYHMSRIFTSNFRRQSPTGSSRNRSSSRCGRVKLGDGSNLRQLTLLCSRVQASKKPLHYRMPRSSLYLGRFPET